MTEERVSTKDRIMYASAELFRRQGYSGTGVKQIVSLAEAPFGSLYHFFPGGKEQLGDEVLRASGLFFLALFESFFEDGDDPADAVERFFAGAAQTLRDTDYADACPIATVALEVASSNETLRVATADVFKSWIDAGTERFSRAGIAPATARELAVTTILAIEGAFVLSRAMRTTEPLAVAGASTATAVRQAMGRPG